MTALSVDASSYARAAWSWTLGDREDLARNQLEHLSDEDLTEVYLTAHRLAEIVNDHQVQRFGFKPMPAALPAGVDGVHIGTRGGVA